jgi:proline iminopeptidase
MARVTRRLVLCCCLLLALVGSIPAALAQEIVPAERVVMLNGIATRVVEAGGTDAAETAILLHGGPGESSDYLAGLFALAGPGLRVVTYDQRGVGGTAPPADGDYSTPALIADLDALVTALDAAPVHLVGNSWGGFLAAAYTGTHPGRVASLTLIGAMPLLPAPDAILVWTAGGDDVDARIAALQEEGLIADPLPRWIRDDDCAYWDAILPAYMSDPVKEEPDRTALPRSTCSLRVNARTYDSAMDFTFDAAYRDAIVPTARAWSGPVYVVFGADDPFRAAYAAPAAAAFPAAELTVETVPAAGHYPWAEDATLIERLRAFILGAS